MQEQPKSEDIMPMIKMGKEKFPGRPELREMVLQGYDLKQAMDNAKAKMELLHEKILEYIKDYFKDYQTGTINVLTSGVKLTASLKQNFNVLNPESVKELLGERYADLMVEKISYRLSPKLKEMLVDADDQTGMALREFFNIKDAKAGMKYEMIP